MEPIVYRLNKIGLINFSFVRKIQKDLQQKSPRIGGVRGKISSMVKILGIKPQLFQQF
jgi:hypothetical protein